MAAVVEVDHGQAPRGRKVGAEAGAHLQRAAPVDPGRAAPHQACSRIVAGEAVVDLPLRRQALADVEPLDLAAPLPLRAVELQAEDVEPEGERHVEELVQAVRPPLRIGQELVAAIELDLPPRGEIASEAMAVELGRQLEGVVAEQQAGAGTGEGDEVEPRVEDVARGRLARVEEAEEPAVGILAAEAEAGVGDARVGAGEECAQLELEEVGGRVGRILQGVRPSSSAARPVVEAEGLVGEGAVPEPVGEVEPRQARAGPGAGGARAVELRGPFEAELQRQLLVRPHGDQRAVTVDFQAERQPSAEQRRVDIEVVGVQLDPRRVEALRPPFGKDPLGHQVEVEGPVFTEEEPLGAALGDVDRDPEVEEAADLAEGHQDAPPFVVGR